MSGVRILRVDRIKDQVFKYDMAFGLERIGLLAIS